MTIGHKLLGLIINPTEPALLGGFLRFVSYRDTNQLLKNWAPERSALKQLAILSEQLVDFPSIELPLTSKQIHAQFSGHLGVDYLAVQLSTRKAPGLTSRDQLKVTCFRVWLLLKALEFSEAGHRADQSLNHLCTQLRMALDDRDGGKKLSWFLTFIEPAPTLEQFQGQLLQNIEKAQVSASGTTQESIRSIKSLLKGQHRPEKHIYPDWVRALPLHTGKEDYESDEVALQVEDRGGDVLVLTQTEDEDGLQVTVVPVDQNQTPPQVSNEARGIALQTQEDQQYLPYSWNRLRADELVLLKESINTHLAVPNRRQRLLAAITALALFTKRSMRTIESLKLSPKVGADWQLDLENNRLHRLPARREVRWQPDGVSRRWIQPLSDQWVFELDPAICDALRAAAQEQCAAENLGQLWGNKEPTLETSFNRWCQEVPGLGRISSGLLVRQPEQIAFEETHDHTYARLITAPARAGIPGSGAYPSWSTAQVARTINLIGDGIGCMPATEAELNALGSELDPDDQLLKEALARNQQHLNELGLAASDWISYHNHLTAHGVLLLLASTGARPVTSVFETIRQFDIEQRHIFIDDKVSRSNKDGTAGRLVPMLDVVAEFLTNTYLPHLKHLADGLQAWLPDVSAEIRLQLGGHRSDKLPFFFFFKSKPEFDWVEVSEASMRALGLVHWPLPLNLFRHRLATRLRNVGLDAEIIDAQLGHAESGSETFSDFSPRCWGDEQASWTIALAKSLEPLCIGNASLAFPTIRRIELSPGYISFQNEEFFGRSAREQQRAIKKSAAEKKAQEEIQEFIGGRPIDSIAPGEWERLGRSMLLTENNLRQPNAAVRYEVYESFIQRVWRENGQRPKLNKWLARLPKPQTVILPHVIGVSRRLEVVRRALDLVFADKTLSVSKSLAAHLAALDLCLFGRVSARKVIEGLAAADKSCVRLVFLQGRAYIEYSEWLGKVDDPPVQRFGLPSRSARYADRALSAGKNLGGLELLPDCLRGIADALDTNASQGLTVRQMIEILTRDISQENAYKFPGIVAGTLAARVEAAALPWADWVRVRTGEARVNPNGSSENAVELVQGITEEELVVPRSSIGVIRDESRERSKVAGRKFLSKIRDALKVYLDSRTRSQENADSAVTRNKRSNTDTAARRAARIDIEQILKKPDQEVSVAVYSLGVWALHLLYRPYKKGLLDAASIKRYMDALAHGFISFGYELDLADLDGDELTDFYRSVVEGTKNDKEDETGIEDGDVLITSGRKRSEKYVLQRLEEFHRFAEQRYGLDTPDWAEISADVVGGLSNPGTICESEYLESLQLLCPDGFSSAAVSVRDAFFLLLTYRFGLRGSEAIGLRRTDWVDVSGAVVVLVSSRYRQLKTRGSQRQIPLLENLTDQELTIVRRWFSHWSTEGGNNESIPLFFDDSNKEKVIELSQIRGRVLTALRAATKSQRTTIHHARHAFANRFFQYLVLRDGYTAWAQHQTNDASLADSVKRAVLVTDKCGRRSLWGVGRLLGHTTPNTTLSSYIHAHFDWAACCVGMLEPNRFAQVQHRKDSRAVDLDAWRVDTEKIIRVPTNTSIMPERCTPSIVLKYFRLRAQGVLANVAGEQCRLAGNVTQMIEAGLASAGKSLSGSKLQDAQLSSIFYPLKLLGRIQRHRWQPLIDFVESREGCSIPEVAGLEAVGCQVGKTRQLLLWSRLHFEQISLFMQWIGFEKSHLDFYRPKKLDKKFIASIEGFRFSGLKDVISEAGRKVFQVDVAAEIRPDGMTVMHPDRVAVVVNMATPVLQDNFELILVWLSFSLAQVSVSSAGVSITSKDTSS